MRPYFSIFAFLLAFAVLAGCSDKTPSVAPTADSSSSSAFLSIPAEGGYVSGSFIIVLSSEFQPDVKAATEKLDRSINDLAHGYMFTVTQRYETVLLGFAATMDEETAARLAKDPRVEMIERDRWSQAFVQTIPTGITRIDADQSSTLAGNGSGAVTGVDCYIIDTGIMPTHPDLNVVGGATFVPNTTSYADGYGHGTHVAGIVAARDNASYVVGAAPGADLYAVRVLDNNGSGQNSWIIAGINWVAARKVANPSRPMIANMSLGGYTGSTTYTTMDIAVRNSVNAGIVYTVAAGNSAANAQYYTPAHVTEALTVGAYDPVSNRWASFSNYGSIVDILAPGVNILSTYYNGGTATMSGTSMAAPHVAGVAALYLAANPGATPANVRTALLNAAANPTKRANPAVTRVKPGTTTLSVYEGNF